MKQMVNIILGSGSPRRKELLKQIKLEFTVITSQAEEVIKQEESNLPAHIVRTLAKQKSMDILANFPTNFDHKNKPTIIICADTIVCMDQIKMGKPRDEADAVEILMRLSGRNHQVYRSEERRVGKEC